LQDRSRLAAICLAQQQPETNSRSVAEKGDRSTTRELSGTLKHKLGALSPPDDAGSRALFTTTDSDWIAVFDNHFASSNVGNIIAIVSERIGSSPAILYTDIPNTFVRDRKGNRGLWGRLALVAYGEQASTGVWGITRSISLSNDVSGWEFQEVGEPWAFEDRHRYDNRPVMSSFDRELAEQYLLTFGIRANDPGFYQGAAIATKLRSPLLGRVKTYDPLLLREQMQLD